MSREFFKTLAVCLATLAGGAAAQDSSGLAYYEAGGFSDAARGKVDLTLQLSQGVPWRLFTLDDPKRLVIDFREVDWSRADEAQLDQSDAVRQIRAGALRPGWTRMVAVLDRAMAVEQAEMRADPDSGKASLQVMLRATDDHSFAQSAGLPNDPTWDLSGATQLRPKPKDPDAPMVIMLDPGHGGIDPGAQRSGVNEADLMLRFAFELQEVLRRTGRYQVLMTRNSDVFVSLEARVAKAHQANADLFISLHADALLEGQAHGATIYTLSEEASDAASQALAERHNRSDLLAGLDLSGTDDRVAQVLMDLARLDNTPRSQALATHLIGGIKNALGQVHKRPLRQAGFSVLKAADIPSVLIELGFLSTEQDLINLQDPVWRAGMAAGIRDGVNAWALEDKALSRLRRQ
jgi:N-acetylmuramoyl-L-alanine amidase